MRGENVFEPLVPATRRSAAPSFSGFTKQQFWGERGEPGSGEGWADGNDGREDGGGGRVFPFSLSSSLSCVCGLLKLLPTPSESSFCGTRRSPAGGNFCEKLSIYLFADSKGGKIKESIKIKILNFPGGPQAGLDSSCDTGGSPVLLQVGCSILAYETNEAERK